MDQRPHQLRNSAPPELEVQCFLYPVLLIVSFNTALFTIELLDKC